MKCIVEIYYDWDFFHIGDIHQTNPVYCITLILNSRSHLPLYMEVPFVLNPFARLLMILRQETGNNNSLLWWCAKLLMHMHCDEVNNKQGPIINKDLDHSFNEISQKITMCLTKNELMITWELENYQRANSYDISSRNVLMDVLVQIISQLKLKRKLFLKKESKRKLTLNF